jgi:hypothetical protein
MSENFERVSQLAYQSIVQFVAKAGSEDIPYYVSLALLKVMADSYEAEMSAVAWTTRKKLDKQTAKRDSRENRLKGVKLSTTMNKNKN